MYDDLLQCFRKRNISPMPVLECFDTVTSTNDYLKQLLGRKEKPQLPYIVLAAEQTSGRGRGNNVWWSGSGSLAMSIGWNLADKGLEREQLMLLAPAVADAVIQAVKNTVDFNWKDILTIRLPNDIYADGKKLGGILIESPSPFFAVIGIGLNVNNSVADVPPVFREMLKERPINSIIDITKNKTGLNELTAEIVLQLDKKVADIFFPSR